MMKNLKAGFLILMLIMCAGQLVLAQTPTRLGPAPDEEIKKAQVVVEANMDSLRAHRNYIFAKGMGNPALLDQYEVWMKKYPNNVNIPLAIGTTYFRASMPQPKDFLLRAAAMDPKNAQIWYMLATDADLRSQHDLLRQYLEKAMSLDPSNATYAYGYLKTFENEAPDQYEKKVFEFANDFPQDQRGAAAIYQLGLNAQNINDKIRYFEGLRELFPPQKFEWSVYGMAKLADAYLETDPEKALALINELDWEGDWKIRKEVAESLIKIDKLERDQNYKEAIAQLGEVKLIKPDYLNDFIALKKASLWEKAGDIQVAYDSLSVKFAKLPTDPLYSALESYGKRLGKDKKQVDNDIEILRNSTAVPAYPFELGLYTSDEKLDLRALKGKVVLLTFWFPGCQPCREEFPHFQKVIDSFKGDSVVYIGINVIPSQDGYVLPFMKNTKYSFTPLRSNFAFAKQNFGVQGAPENFVIDKDGRIIFKDFRTDGSNQRTLELMIASLLEKEPARD